MDLCFFVDGFLDANWHISQLQFKIIVTYQGFILSLCAMVQFFLKGNITVGE